MEPSPTHSPRSRPRGLRRWIAIATLLAGVGCSTTVTLDMRNIEEPVMLNALPYPHADRDWTAREVGPIRAKVEKDKSYIGNAHVSRTSTSFTNEAEANVYEKIGGYDSRAISAATIKVEGVGLNLLFAYLGGVTIDFNASVVELDSEADGTGGAGAADEAHEQSEETNE